MGRATEAPATIQFLQATGGADWEQIANHFGISRDAVVFRIKAARRYLVATGADLAIPRPTAESGWKFTLTRAMYSSTPAEVCIGRSTEDDLIAIRGTCERLQGDLDVAWDAIPSGQRRYKPARAVRELSGALAVVVKICNDNHTAIENVLATYVPAGTP